MANVAVTLRCDRACAYCFVPPGLLDGGASQDMKMEVFDEVVDWLMGSQIGELRLLGGEPTLHPSFVQMVEKGMERGMDVRVFTHGRIRGRTLQYLSSLPADRLGVLVNVTGLEKEGGEETEAVRDALASLGPRATLGYTFQRRSNDLSLFLDWIVESGLNPRIRLGMAQPVFGGRNLFFPVSAVADLGEVLLRLEGMSLERGIGLDFDCGFPACALAPLERERTGSREETSACRCAPVPDVLPDGSAVPCFALGKLIRTRRLATVEDTRDALNRALAPYREIGTFVECGQCRQRESGRCEGGCLSSALRRLHGPAPGPRSQANPSKEGQKPATEAEARYWIPYIDQPLSFWEALAERWRDRIAGVYLPPADERLPTGRPRQPREHLEELFARPPFRLSLLLNGIPEDPGEGGTRDLVWGQIERLGGQDKIAQVVLSRLDLAELVRERFPGIQLAASVLMDVRTGEEAMRLNGLFDALVPSSAVLRDLDALKEIRRSFNGTVRLLLNEGCLRTCPFREEHFREMAGGVLQPGTPCESLLAEEPWLCLTGAWVLPQHLWMYQGVYDELKLSGRVTLRDPKRYLRVLDGYLLGRFLSPHQIGGGPGAPRHPIFVESDFFRETLRCGGRCGDCSTCRSYYERWGPPRDGVTKFARSSTVDAEKRL